MTVIWPCPAVSSRYLPGKHSNNNGKGIRMKLSICHYSYHREVGAGRMDIPNYFKTVRDFGLDACDLHMRLIGDFDKNKETILKGLEENNLSISSYSLSDDLTVEDEEQRRQQIENIRTGLRHAHEMGADTARVFGGHAGTNDPGELARLMQIVVDGFKECAEVAEEVKVVMAVENHGGMPGRGEEVVEVIEKVGSDYLKSCCDVGNFMGAGQEPVEGTRQVAPLASYVHVKDNKVIEDPDRARPRAGKAIRATVVGEGVVDIPSCLKILRDAGYKGYVALEYEGEEEEPTGVEKSLSYLRQVLSSL